MNSIRLLVKILGAMFGGLVLIAVGMSQAIFGWISDGILARVFYGFFGTGFGLAMFIGSAYWLWLQFFPHHDTEPENIDEITLTKRAASAARQFMADRKLPLRVSVKELEEGGYRYSLKIEKNAPLPSDLKIRQRGVDLLVNQSLMPLLSGTTIDFVENENGRGFRFATPNEGQTLAEATANYNAINRDSNKKLSVAVIAGLALLLCGIVGGIGAGVLIVGNEFTRDQSASDEEAFKKSLSPERYEMFYGRRPDAAPAADSLTETKPEPSEAEIPSEADRPSQLAIVPSEVSDSDGDAAADLLIVEKEAKRRREAEERTDRSLETRPPAERGRSKETKRPIRRSARRSANKPKPAAPHFEAGKVPVLEFDSELLTNRRSISLLKLSPDGQRVIIGNDANDLEVFDLNANKKMFSTKRIGIGMLQSIAISSNNRTVVSGYFSGGTVIWDIDESGELTQRLKLECEDKKPIKSLAIQPAGQLLATGGEKLTVWDIATQKVIFQDQLQGAITSCQFLDDGQTIAFSDGGSAKTVSISNKETQKSIGDAGKGFPCDSAISSNGKLLLSNTGTETSLTSLQTGEAIGTFDSLIGAIFSVDGKHFLTKWDDQLLVWSSDELVCVAKIELEKWRGRSVVMSESQILMVTDRNKKLQKYQFAP